MRIVVSGGGSAGHISPTLAVSAALKQRAASTGQPLELLYVGQTGGMEERIVAASGISFQGIASGKFRRDHFAGVVSKVLNPRTLGLNARDAARSVRGLADALRVLRKFRPDVVFLKGGYVCLPIGIAAHLLRIPYVIHESDLEPGLTNRTLARWATTIAVGFPVQNYPLFAAKDVVFTGNPVRPEVLAAHPLEGRGLFNLLPDLPTLLVTGGSQGAVEINDVVVAALPELLELCQIIHVTGEGEFQRLSFARKRIPELTQASRYHVYGFLLKEMPAALAAADIVLGRAGAGTIAESAALGKVTILIPNTSMAGHQVRNARVVARAGAARVLQGESFTAQTLVREVRGLLGNQAERERLGEAIRAFGRPDAAGALAEVVLRAAKQGSEPGEGEADEVSDLQAGEKT